VLFLQVRRWVRTKVMLHPKEDQLEHVEEKKLRDLVKKHSEFVSYPISFRTEKASTKQVSDYEDEEVDKAGEKRLRKERFMMLPRKPYLPTPQPPTYPPCSLPTPIFSPYIASITKLFKFILLL
jgi:hypothetical protein